jgi:hypothetical protein
MNTLRRKCSILQPENIIGKTKKPWKIRSVSWIWDDFGNFQLENDVGIRKWVLCI